jgi:vitamin B12 transporter
MSFRFLRAPRVAGAVVRPWLLALGVVVVGTHAAGVQAQTGSTGAMAPDTGAALQRSLADTVVTATRAPIGIEAVVGDITVIARHRIEMAGARSLTELLAREAGVQITANGGAGAVSGVFVRGTESRHTLLLIDGVPYGSATVGSPVWDTVPLDAIERIEVLKGPASSLYGSEALGGVVQIFTRRSGAGAQPYVALGLGSEGRRQIAAGTGGGDHALGWALGVMQRREDGFSATNPRVQFGNFNPDRDPYGQASVHASVQAQLHGDWRLQASTLLTDGTFHWDDGAGSRDTRSAVRSTLAQTTLNGRINADWLAQFKLGRSSDTTNALAAGFPSAFTTTQTLLGWQNTLATGVGTLVAGLEHRAQDVDSSTTRFAVTTRHLNAVYAGLSGQSGRWTWQASGRHDRNSQFGSAATGGLGLGFALTPQWRVQASHGTSFVAPSFNQLYFPNFGNPALQPERGRNSEVGVVFRSGRHEAKLMRFEQRIRGYITSTTMPVNVPRSQIDGYTLAYSGAAGAWAWRLSADSLDPRNAITGRLLPRRARSQINAALDHHVGAWRYGAHALHVGDRFDDTQNRLPLAAFTTLDLHASVQLAPQWRLQLALANVGDKVYETAYGYNQPRRSVWLQLRWQAASTNPS